MERRRKRKSHPKIKHKLVVKINLVIISFEWHIEWGGL